jgi:hypothetical protein
MTTSILTAQCVEAGNLHDLVVFASHQSYLLNGENAHLFSMCSRDGMTFPDLLIPALRRIEEIETEETFSSIDDARLRSFIEAGLEVWVVVPLSCMDRAHSRLRGLATRIQAWWIADDALKFGNPELP